MYFHIFCKIFIYYFFREISDKLMSEIKELYVIMKIMKNFLGVIEIFLLL